MALCTALLNQVLWMNVCLCESIFGFKQEGQICNGQLCGQTWCLAVLGRDCELVTDCMLCKAVFRSAGRWFFQAAFGQGEKSPAQGHTAAVCSDDQSG